MRMEAGGDQPYPPEGTNFVLGQYDGKGHRTSDATPRHSCCCARWLGTNESKMLGHFDVTWLELNFRTCSTQ